MGAASSSSGSESKSENTLAWLYGKYNDNVVPQMLKASLTAADVSDLRGMLGEVRGAGEFLGGGGSSCVGGYDALQDYGNSLFSKAKEKLIREIAEEVFSALKISGAKNAKTAPISDVVAHLKKLSPNPAKGKRFNEAFNSSSGKQKAVCHALANAINSNYGGRIINMDASDSEMCNQVAEVMYSLLTGLHTEFLNVAGDVTRIMKNMQVVEGALTSAYKKQVELVDASGDARLREQSQNSAKLYNEIKAEYDRQAAILANLMNVSIGPSGKSLITALEDNRDFAGLVRDLKAEAGTTAFGDKLAHLLSGISTVAHSAELIDKALRKIGMSVGEFKSAKNAGDLRARVLNTIMKDSPNSKQLDEMMAAAQIIFNNNYDHDAISKLLNGSSKKGRGESFGGDADGGGSDDDVEGAAEGGDDVLPTYWQKKSLSKKIENKTKYRDLVLKDFRKLLKSHYQQVVDAANQLSGKVGRVVPVSDQLDYFVRAFSQLPNLDKENLHIALSGYAKDSASREKREQFMNDYILLDQAIEPLTKGPEGSLFKNLQVAVRAMTKSIDDFSEKMVKALTEIHVDRPDEIQLALKRSANLFYGSGDSGEDSFGSGSWVAFEKVKNEMKYFYSIANIKTNMSRFADDIKTYSDDYDQLLGEEAGWLINNIKKEFLELINFTDPSKGWADFPDPKPAAGSRAHTLQRALFDYNAENIAEVTAAAAGPAERIAAATANKDNAAKAHKNLVKLWTAQMNAKETMVKVAQAVDLYLKSFTDGIARHPDAISSVLKMLDQVDIVARWFNDKSGDNLSYLFEMFPESTVIQQVAGGAVHQVASYSYGDAGNAPVRADGSINTPGKTHYYEYVEEQAAKNRLPGNPFLGRPLGQTEEKQFDGIMNLTEKTIKGMRALENILSAFASVGSKFGDLDPAARTFMTPGQMFNGLVDYIKMSAFTSQFATGAAADVAVVGGVGGHNGIGQGSPITAALYHSKTEGKVVADSVGNGAQAIPLIAQNNHRPAGDNADAGLHWSQHLAANQARANKGAALVHAADDRTKHGILTGVNNVRELPANPGRADRYRLQSLAMSAIPYDSNSAVATFWEYHDFSKPGVRLDAAGWTDFFYDTDLLFEMSIKSIVAKIFTVVDAYRLFNRPTMQRELSYSLNPLRTIIGGSAKSIKIIPEAAELYLRLPLLAEWYREIYGFKNDTVAANAQNWVLSIVPSIDGTWSEFVGVIFDKAREVKEGNYSESQAQTMISAMNDIYKAYKSKYPKATIRNIINSFVIEMNRIFGFLKQTEINNYLNQRRDFLKGQADGDKEDFMDYDILNANDQFGSRPAPSDKFINVGLNNKPVNRIPMQKLQSEVYKLRAKMDASLNEALVKNTGADGLAKVSFTETLKNYKKELENAKSDEDQYQIVLQLVQSANKSADVSADKLIMVHEAVATPLALLYGVHKVLARFNALVHGASVVNLAGWNSSRPAVPVGAFAAAPAACKVALTATAEVRNAYRAYLEFKYDKLLTNSKERILDGMVSAFTGNAAGGPLNGTNCGYYIKQVGTRNAGGDLNHAPDIDAAHLLQDLLNALADLSVNSSKLVSCSVGTGGNINLDFSPLQDLCANLLSQVKSNIQKLRTSFPPGVKTVDRYENSNNVGSTRWLEENLMEVLFNDRDQCGLSTGYSSHLIKTMAQLMTNGDDVPITETSGFPTVDNALRGLIYYEFKQGIASLPQVVASCRVNKFPWNVIPMKKTADSGDEKTVMTASSGTTEFANAANEITAANGLFQAPIVYFETKDSINNFNVANKIDAAAAEDLQYNSLLTRFNKLVHMYLYTNLEEGALKIYTPLFEPFMNGAASREVLQNKAFPNVGQMIGGGDSAAAIQAATAAGAALALYSPPDSTVLYATTAMAMRSMATSVTVLGTMQKKKHAYDNVAEIPEFMKERMRANLPYFSKLFQEINDRADFLKRILTYTSVNRNIASCVTAGNHSNVRPGSINTDLKEMNNGAPLDTVANSDYLNGLLTRFIELSASIKKCCDSVYKELNDKPVPFLETSKDFIADYKRKNGTLPLMPVSALLAPMASLNRTPVLDDTVDSGHLMLPVVTNGSNAYKFNNAAKLLLSDLNAEPNIDHFPGAKEIYNMYADSTDGNLLSSAEYTNTVKLLVKLAKFLNTGVVQARMFGRPQRNMAAAADRHNCGSVFGITWEPSHTTDVSTAAALDEKNYAIMPLVFGQLAHIIENTENSNIKYAKERLAQLVGVKVGVLHNDKRKQLQVFNILDMNIVPINVHAFMREIPFVNILNYAYTFDRMIHDFVLPSYVKNLGATVTDDNIMIKADSDVTNPRELLVKLLAHPYADLGTNSPQYFALLASLFNGNDDMKLGRPRYLSDQLWHKALLTSSVQLGYGNNATNLALPTIANTNLALGPAGYEAQRGAVKARRNQTVIAADVVRNIITETLGRDAAPGPATGVAAAANVNGINGVRQKAVIVAAAQAMTQAPNPGFNAADAVTISGGNHEAGARVLAALLAMRDALANNDAVVLGRVGIPRSSPELNDFMSKWYAEAKAQHDMGAEIQVILNDIMEHGIAQNAAGVAACRTAILGAVTGHVTPLVAGLRTAVLGTVQAGAVQPDFRLRVMTGEVTNAPAIGGPDPVVDITGEFAQSVNALLVALNYIDSQPSYPKIPAQFKKMLIMTLVGARGAVNTIYAMWTALTTNTLVAAGAPRQNFTAEDHFLSEVVTERVTAAGGNAGDERQVIRTNFLRLWGSGSIRILYETPFKVLNDMTGPGARKLVESASLVLNGDPVAAVGLKYRKNDRWSVVNVGGKNMDVGNVVYCAELGRARFDTKLVRNLTWLVQLQRIMRVVLINHLSWINTPVVRGLKIADPKVTEFEANEQFDEDDYNGKGYSVM